MGRVPKQRHQESQHKEIIIQSVYTEAQAKRSKQLAQLIEDGIAVKVPAIAFLRGAKRKPKETFVAYKRSIRNMNRAMKQYLRFGPKTNVLINKETMVVIV
jgi:hypothetical protein